jgi:hypothetical protein
MTPSCPHMHHLLLLFRRESTRRRQNNNSIHERLEHARRLRASLEEAADRAESLPNLPPRTSYAQAMSILQSSMSEIDELVRLTTVLKNGKKVENGLCSTIRHDSVANTKQWEERNATKKNEIILEEQQRQERLRDQRTLRRQLRLFAKERNPKIEIDEELERRHDDLINRCNINNEGLEHGRVNDGMAGIEVDSQGKDVQYNKEGSFDKLKSADVNDIDDTDTNNHTAQTAKGDANSIQGGSEPVSTFHVIAGRKGLAKVAVQMSSKHDDENDSPSQRNDRDKTKDRRPSNEVADKSIRPQHHNGVEDAQEKNNSGGCTGIVSGRNASQITHALLRKPLTKRAKIIPEAEGGSINTPESSAPVPPPVPPPVLSRPPRKCQECKKTCTVYRSCNYWNWSVKCHKKYCIPCLLSKYTRGFDDVAAAAAAPPPLSSSSSSSSLPTSEEKDDDAKNPHSHTTLLIEEIGINPEHDKEWHCPSCVAQRELEEERERSRMTEVSRKSSRKSAMGNNYSNFF